MKNQDLKTIIVETAKSLLDLGKIFFVMGSIIQKANKDGLLDDLGKISLKGFDLDDQKVIEATPEVKPVCEHDRPENSCWEDRGHGFHQCLICGALKEEKKKVT